MHISKILPNSYLIFATTLILTAVFSTTQQLSTAIPNRALAPLVFSFHFLINDPEYALQETHIHLSRCLSLSSPMENEMGLSKYSRIYKAAIANDWEIAKPIFGEEKNVFYEFTCFGFNSDNSYTPLHLAVGTNKSHLFVKQLVDWIMRVGDVQMLRIRDKLGRSALHYAAIVGNTKAARLLIDIDPEMAQMPNSKGWTPLTMAAAIGQEKTLRYLLKVTKDVVSEEGIYPYRRKIGADLLVFTINSDFYDVALYLVEKYPDLVTERNTISEETALEILAGKSNAFQSGSKLGFWHRIIYSSSYGFIVFFWSVLQYLAPHIKQMHERKVRHLQSTKLVKLMCSNVMNKGDELQVWNVFGEAISTAVKNGIYELIEQCCHHYPPIIGYQVEELNLFMAAISERQEKVYNLVYQMSGHKVFTSTDNSPQGNALHIAGKLAPLQRLNTVTGAALQMQRELQWFKEVEKFVLPTRKTDLNKEGKTPRMVFTSEHEELLQEAKQWMKDTSSSATVVAALIVTIAFAAIFTAPGGNNDNGKPLFLNDGVFILFAISDAIALFSSSTSVIMLLAVLSSRFAEDDFLYSLPKRLTLGLISLFISIAAIMVAFSATLSLVLRDKIQWIAAPVVLLASVPVTLFLLLQYPLLVELVRSTYGKGIFYKQNKLLLH